MLDFGVLQGYRDGAGCSFEKSEGVNVEDDGLHGAGKVKIFKKN